MKKNFEKPTLFRNEIRLNENIALSWEYYLEGEDYATFHFTHMVDGYTAPQADAGCYDYYTANLEWSTSETGAYGQWFASQHYYTDINSKNAMIAWMNDLDYTYPSYNCET